jgi:hypothetical protein
MDGKGAFCLFKSSPALVDDPEVEETSIYTWIMVIALKQSVVFSGQLCGDSVLISRTSQPASLQTPVLASLRRRSRIMQP